MHAATHEQLRNALAIAIVKSKKQKDAEVASCQQKIATLEHELIRAKAATSQLYKLVRRHLCHSTAAYWNQQPATRACWHH